MIAFPNAKINLGLHVLSRRADGYHNLETVFYPVNLKDAVEIVENYDTPAPEVLWGASGITVPGDLENNLCLKAFHLIKNDFSPIPPIKLHLHKNIPLGAGLGGGSANAAFTLQLLNEKFNLQIPKNKLQQYALKLGSDCPFFLVNNPSLAHGRGEELLPIEINLDSYKILMVNPGIIVNTAWAFSKIELQPQQRETIASIIKMPVTEWKNRLENDFEKPVFAAHPQIKNIKEALYEQGAVYAAMSGSGSSVFGIFHEQKEIKFPETYFCKWV
ncbi:MAG TPA: 4-(cytidine 5'-diphospho)-2-C-methyl-D-erythritol kinase [Ferruginibacter sp.]|nr:4-(cytidine 5'-diphospho)-2-C-methyl-D-erythritol kinase [Ferruginibacter sp.]